MQEDKCHLKCYYVKIKLQNIEVGLSASERSIPCGLILMQKHYGVISRFCLGIERTRKNMAPMFKIKINSGQSQIHEFP